MTTMNPRTETALSIVAYSICSGTLVLLNKLILHHLPYPSLVVSFQLIATLLFILVATQVGYLATDPIRWKYVVPYLYYTVAFALGVYCNMRSLSASNVETVILFRALSPCLVAFLDAIFLGRELPNRRSWLALGLLVLGAYGYASFDEQFRSQGPTAYMWPFLYLCIISFEMAYGKIIVRSVDLKTRSGPVMYTNILGLTPMLVFAAMGHEYARFAADRAEGKPIPAAAAVFLVMGCIAGTGIGYSSWWCRDRVSATTFTLVGVINKCLTILLNLLVWDKHAPPAGIASLFVCLLGGTIYQQSPLRNASTASSKAVAAEADDVWDANMSFMVRDDDEIDPLLDSSQVVMVNTTPAPDRVKRRTAA